MGRRKWYKCNCISCFRAKLKVNDDTPLQHLPKPKEAGKNFFLIVTCTYVDSGLF